MGGKNNRYFNLTQKLKIKSEMSLKNKITFVLILSVILTVAYALLGQNRDNSVKTVVRPVQGETKQVDIQVIEEGSEEPVDISFKVAPKTYSREEAKKLLEESAQNLEEFIKGDNEDLSHVKQNLKLDGYLSQYGIKAEWMSSDYELISYDGEVYNEDFENDEKRNVTLTSNLSIGEESISKVIDVTVLAKDYTAEEQKQKSILAAVEKAQLSEAEKDTFSLPDSADGKKIKFMLPGNKPVPIVFMGLGVMASVFIYISDKNKKERLQK